MTRIHHKHQEDSKLVADYEANLQNKPNTVRLIITGTPDHPAPGVWTSRFEVYDPAGVAGLLFIKAIYEGQLDEVLKMCDEMVRIASSARGSIMAEVNRRKSQN